MTAALLLVAGIGLVAVGADRFVVGAGRGAARLGVPPLVVGLTVVAFATSASEVVLTVLAVGNAVGSSTFNLLGVLGLGAVLSAAPVEFPAAALRFDALVMVGTAVACLPIFLTGHRIDRWEGAVFLGYHAGYLSCLILDARAHEAAGAVRAALSWFVAPLTLLTVAVVATRWRRADPAPVPPSGATWSTSEESPA